MKQENYHCSFTADVTADQAHANIANVGGWWKRTFRGSALKAGDTFDLDFGETKVAFEITEAVPGKKSVWRVTDCYLHWLKDTKEWKGTEVVWDIASTNGTTKIDMTHIGITPEVECFEDCKKGWDGYIKGSLFKLVTEGVGKPD